MGVDTKIMLPGRVRLQDVARVLGALAGCKTELKVKPTYVYCQVDDVKVDNSHTPECANIRWTGGGELKPDGYVMFHYEPCEFDGRLLMPRSTPWWIAAGKRLVDFFGGKVDFNDCDDVDVDYERPSPGDIAPSDGEPWREFQRRMSEVKAITAEDLAANDKLAAYPGRG
jgi:hypothetical protein